MTRPARCWLLAAGCWLAGCATVPFLLPRIPKATGTESAAMDDGYHDYNGVIHVHTNPYSYDAFSPLSRAIQVAQLQHLDYLIVTDHNSLGSLRDGQEGMHGKTLVLIGEEVSTKSGHYLACHITQEPDRRQPAQAVIDDVNRQGGFGFIAHPYWKRRPWADWSVTGYTGLEIYNTVHDAFEENLTKILAWAIVAPADTVYQTILSRPYDSLGKWDELLKHGKVVGIGGCDAHDHRIGEWKFAPYELVFQMVRTHLLAHALTNTALYDALRRGHCYVGLDLLSDTTGFTFLAAHQHEVLGVMGDEVPLQPGLVLRVFVPSPARVILYKDGRITAGGGYQQNWLYEVREPGVYRVEVNRGPFPWIFSNPIYVQPAASPAAAGLAGSTVQQVVAFPQSVVDAVSTAIHEARGDQPQDTNVPAVPPSAEPTASHGSTSTESSP